MGEKREILISTELFHIYSYNILIKSIADSNGIEYFEAEKNTLVISMSLKKIINFIKWLLEI